ncbi:MAG: ATP-binding protein [Clostridia bacterium]
MIKNKIIKYLIAFIIPIYLIIYYLKIRTINKKIKELEKQNNNNIENNENEINKLKNQLNLLDNNSKIMEEQIEKEKNKNIYLLNIEKKKIFDKYSDIFNIEKINEIFNENDIDKKINILQTMIENSSNELTKLEIKQEEFEEQFSEIVRLEEEQEVLGNQLEELKEKNDAIELVKETIEKAYEKLKENINPEFNKKLSENISKITNGKYNNILFNDEQGLIVELPNGNYVSADRLSIGTIDQIYLSLRLASIDEISNEKLPIILDEAFAYFDDIRLENIMLFLSKEFKDRQIIIFTCTTRELRILQNNNIEFNFIEL